MAWPPSGMGPKQPKLGSGLRFSRLQAHLSQEPGVRDPGALAASIGRKKFGQAKMTAMSQAGMKKKGGSY